ncbi:MAG: hypothetical protein ACREOJ_04175 [Gemmatimonadaceae bacterium]
MIAAIVRLFALRPLLTMAILGIPLLLIIGVGLFAILAFKFLLFIVLPVVVVIWLVRTVFRSSDRPAS